MATNNAFTFVVTLMTLLVSTQTSSGKLLFILFRFFIFLFQTASLVNNCNGTEIPVPELKGTLSINGSLTVKNVSCVWNLDTPGKVPLSLFLNGKEPVQLHPNDTLEIMNDKGVVSVNLTGDDLKHWGVILSEVSGKAKIRLNISNEDGSRLFHIGYNQESATVDFNYVQSHDYFIPINHMENTGKNGKATFAVTFNLDPKLNPGKLLLVNYRQITMKEKPTYSIEGSTGVKDGSDPVFDLLNDAKTSDSKIIPLKLSFTNFDYSNTRLVLGTEVVDSDCSYYKSLDKTTGKDVLTGPTNPTSGSSLNCVWLIKSDVPLRIDTSQTHKLYGDDDVVEVVDGPQLLKSKILCELNKENLDESEHTLDHSVSTKSQLRVSLVSKYVSDPTGLMKIEVSRATKSQVNPSGTISVTGDQDEPNPIFLFTAAIGQKAVFTADPNLIAGTNLSFFSSYEKNELPFMTVYKGDLVPEKMVSPTSILRISTSDGADSKVKGKFESQKTMDSTAVGDSSSLVLLGIPDGSKVSWLLPRRPSNGSLHLNIPRLVLSNSDKNCIELIKIVDKLPTIFKACYNPKLESVKTRALPRILLNSVYSYVLTYTTGTGTLNGTSLMEATATYVNDGCSLVNRTLLDSGAVVLAPESYPNNYRLNEESVDGVCHSWMALGKPSTFVHVVFDDVDLLGDQKLTIAGPKISPYVSVLNKDAVLANQPDIIAENQTFFQMDSPLKSSYSDLNGISGRGFKVNITSTNCGGAIDADKVTNLTTVGYPVAAAHVSKCIWIVTSSKKNGILNITRTFGKDGGDGELVIYDNDNSRVNRYNESYVKNETFTTSVSSTVITYTPKDPSKPLKALMLNWTVDCKFYLIC